MSVRYKSYDFPWPIACCPINSREFRWLKDVNPYVCRKIAEETIRIKYYGMTEDVLTTKALPKPAHEVAVIASLQPPFVWLHLNICALPLISIRS